jgi:hypothetical protein
MSQVADWSCEFDDPFPVADGRVLKILHDAGHDARLAKGRAGAARVDHAPQEHAAILRAASARACL